MYLAVTIFFLFLLYSRTPLATFLEFKSDIVDMDLDEERWLWVTAGSDKIVKVCVCVCSLSPSLSLSISSTSHRCGISSLLSVPELPSPAQIFTSSHVYHCSLNFVDIFSFLFDKSSFLDWCAFLRASDAEMSPNHVLLCVSVIIIGIAEPFFAVLFSSVF